MVKISDQFEIEPASIYSGSYTDSIFSPGSIFSSNRFVVYSHANPSTNAREFPDGLSIPKLYSLSILFGKNFRLGRYDIEFPSLGIQVNQTSSLVPKENIVSPSQNLLVKLFSSNEQFSDTVLPRPPDIARANGAKFTEGLSEFIYPGGFYMRGDSSHNLTGSTGPVARQPKKFVITLGSGQESNLTSSADATQISDNAWAYSFPFESKYSSLDTLLRPNFDKKYKISHEQKLQSRNVDVSGTTEHQGAVDLYVEDHRHTTYISNVYTLQYCFLTTGDESFRDKPYANRRRYVKLLNVRTETSGGIFKPTGSLKYPELDFIYKGFFGFYKKNNDGGAPYRNSFENSRSLPSDIDISGTPLTLAQSSLLRFNGFGQTDPSGNLLNRAGFPIYESVMGYTTWGLTTSSFGFHDHFMCVEDFNCVFLRVNGWKYGVYDALPRNSSCIWRRNKFGQVRDMLEQRPYTKFHNVANGQALRAALEVFFVSGTQAAITASSPLFNSNSSGIYDFEGKSGKPYVDRDNED